MNKCEWIQLKDFSFQFKPCDRFNGKIIEGFYSTDEDNSSIDTFCKCKQCGADISKPEENPIIRKSGDTWVARYDGVDYLWVWKGEPSLSPPADYFLTCVPSYWKPISEIKITDEIAKLRPMVMWGHNQQNSDILCRIREDWKAVLDFTGGDIRNIRLATVSDLEE